MDLLNRQTKCVFVRFTMQAKQCWATASGTTPPPFGHCWFFPTMYAGEKWKFQQWGSRSPWLASKKNVVAIWNNHGGFTDALRCTALGLNSTVALRYTEGRWGSGHFGFEHSKCPTPSKSPSSWPFSRKGQMRVGGALEGELHKGIHHHTVLVLAKVLFCEPMGHLHVLRLLLDHFLSRLSWFDGQIWQIFQK